MVNFCSYVLGNSNEHGYLGNMAFNIGLALSRAHMYMEACPLLDMACKGLKLSCDDGQCVVMEKVSTLSL